MTIQTRITEMLGIEKPIIQAAMGWIARSQLSSAVCNAGGRTERHLSCVMWQVQLVC